MSTTATPQVYAAINAVQADLARDGITKNRRNTQQGYAFRGIDDIYNTLSSLLSKHALSILPSYGERCVCERETKSGGVLFYVTVKGTFRFVSAKDGSATEVVTYGEAMDSADKATNKAMSAALKYACLQAFFIPTEGDNDADNTTHEPVARVSMAPTGAKDTKPTPDLSDAPRAVSVPSNWQDCEIHFGKNKGVKLGDLEKRTLAWYCENWQPKPYQGRIDDASAVLRQMLDKAQAEMADLEEQKATDYANAAKAAAAKRAEPIAEPATVGADDDNIPF